MMSQHPASGTLRHPLQNEMSAGFTFTALQGTLMKKFIGAMTAVMLTAFGMAHAQGFPSHWGSPDDATVNTIIAVEKAWAETSCGISPPPALRAAVAGDFLGTSTRGQRYEKAWALEPGNDHDCKLGRVRVHFFGDSLAVAYGSESNTGKTGGTKEEKRCAIWTDTWLKRDGAWQIISAQDNPVDCR